MVSSGASRTAFSASALARKKRVRWNWVAPIALKNEEALHPGPLGRAQQPHRRQPVQLLDRPARLVADRCGEVDHGVHAAHRVSHREWVGQVPERDPDVDAVGAESPRLAHQRPYVVPGPEQQRQQLAADHPRRARQQDHGPTVATAPAGPRGPPRLECGFARRLPGAATAI